jgi:hypothetical protein
MPLDVAWRSFLEEEQYSSYNYESYLEWAQDRLSSVPFTRTGLEALLLREYGTLQGYEDYTPSWNLCHSLSFFATAGYSLLPDDVVEYGLDTPELDHFGFHLRKTLIVTGALGNNTGHEMQGRLVNHGTLGDCAGSRMRGTFENHGVAGNSAGHAMLGAFVNHGLVGDEAGEEMIGTFENRGTAGDWAAYDMFGFASDHGVSGEGSFLLTGRLLAHNDISWERFTGDKMAFARDITNPAGLSYEDLYASLMRTYWRDS